jgi:hypothetical protein
MANVPESRSPRTTSDLTIWIARSDGPVRSYSVWRGPRTVGALSELLAKLDACGFPASLEVESLACGPVPMTLPDLVDLGLVVEERRAVARVRGLLDRLRLLARREVR